MVMRISSSGVKLCLFACLMVMMKMRRRNSVGVKLKRATSRQGFSPSSAEVILLNRACHYTTKQKSHAFLPHKKNTCFILGLPNSMICLHEDSIYMSRILKPPQIPSYWPLAGNWDGFGRGQNTNEFRLKYTESFSKWELWSFSSLVISEGDSR